MYFYVLDHSYVSGFPTCPGISAELMQLMKIKVNQMNAMARYCILTFDEMSLRKEMRYNASKDIVEGLVHLQDRKPTLANQALVFMIRGISG